MQTRERQLLGVIGFIIVAGLAIAVWGSRNRPSVQTARNLPDESLRVEQAAPPSGEPESLGAVLADIGSDGSPGTGSTQGATAAGSIRGPAQLPPARPGSDLAGKRLDDAIEASKPEEVPLKKPAPSVKITTEGAAKPATASYTVKTGDNLSNISEAHYGTPNRWREIFKANSSVLSDPKDLKPGMVLTIPNAGARAVAKAGSGPTKRPALTMKTTITKAKTHIVGKGETLMKIAAHYYKSSKRWRDILKANSSIISRPEDLQAGMKIIIP